MWLVTGSKIFSKMFSPTTETRSCRPEISPQFPSKYQLRQTQTPGTRMQRQDTEIFSIAEGHYSFPSVT